MDGKLPRSVVNRPKQAYRAPIAHAILRSGNDLVNKHLNPFVVREAGLFNPDTVKHLLKKLYSCKPISEYDNMAFIGILTTQILYKQYVQDYEANKRANKKGVVRNNQI